jgi:hypothetical protein
MAMARWIPFWKRKWDYVQRKESSFGRCIWRAENNGRRAGIRVAMRDTGPFSDLILTFLLKYNSVVSIKGKRRGR